MQPKTVITVKRTSGKSAGNMAILHLLYKDKSNSLFSIARA
jgi:hypothetical protein